MKSTKDRYVEYSRLYDKIRAHWNEYAVAAGLKSAADPIQNLYVFDSLGATYYVRTGFWMPLNVGYIAYGRVVNAGRHSEQMEDASHVFQLTFDGNLGDKKGEVWLIATQNAQEVANHHAFYLLEMAKKV